jgi:hypothetical protein
MEQDTKLIIAVVGLGGLGYFLYKKGLFANKTVVEVAQEVKNDVVDVVTPTPTPTPIPMPLPTPIEPPIVLPSTDGTVNQYPIAAVVTSSQEGRQPTGVKVRLKDGDAVKGVPETVYVLKDGEKHPVTGTWWFYNFGQDWSNVINVTDETLGFIPTGSTYTINGQ